MAVTDQPYSLKVIMTTDTVGGVWTYCIELIRSLEVHKVHFLLVTAGAQMSPGQREEVSALKNVVVHETTLALEWMERPWMQVDQFGTLLLRLEEEYQPDLIHLNSFAAGTLPFQSPVLMVAHSDVCTWWEAVKGGKVPEEWAEYCRRVRDGLSGCNMLIAPSNSYLNALKRTYQIEPQCRVIYNSRDSKLFDSGEKTGTVMGIGRVWDEAKNLVLLANAAKHIEARVVIAGENKFQNSSILFQDNHIELTGKLATGEIALKLSTATIYALPAKYEPFGLSVLEAALSGCALVLGDIETLREIWQDAALYVPTDRADVLASSINDLLNDSNKRKELSIRARSRAACFTGGRMGNEYMNSYETLMRQAVKSLKTEIV